MKTHLFFSLAALFIGLHSFSAFADAPYFGFGSGFAEHKWPAVVLAEEREFIGERANKPGARESGAELARLWPLIDARYRLDPKTGNVVAIVLAGEEAFAFAPTRVLKKFSDNQYFLEVDTTIAATDQHVHGRFFTETEGAMEWLDGEVAPEHRKPVNVVYDGEVALRQVDGGTLRARRVREVRKSDKGLERLTKEKFWALVVAGKQFRVVEKQGVSGKSEKRVAWRIRMKAPKIPGGG